MSDFKLPGHLSSIANSASSLSAPKTLTEHKALDDLVPAPYQPRLSFDEDDLRSLAESIKQRGVTTPLLVRPLGTGKFEIIAGERRWRAARMAGLGQVPVTVQRLSDQDAEYVALMENLQRKDLNAFEEVESRLRLIGAALGIPRDDVPTRLNENLRNPRPEDVEILEGLFSGLGRQKWESFAKNKVRILNWPEPIVAGLRQGLVMEIASFINSAPEDMQADLVALALKGATKAELQAEVKQAQKPKKKPVLREDRLRVALGKRKVITKLPPEKKTRFDELADEMLAMLEER